MSNLFSQVLNMSLTGSVVILIVMLARFILKRSPKIFSYALWSVVLFRLLCPVALTAPVSVLEVVEPEILEASTNISVVTYLPDDPQLQADFVAVPMDSLPEQQEETAENARELRMTPMHAVALVWAAGAVGMMVYSVAQYLLLRRKLVGSVALYGNVYLSDYIDTPFVMGILMPKIYLPSNVPMNEQQYIIAHEQHHIRRCDHIIKLLAYFALCIHWFNPLVWAAFILAGKDMEMSCDEAVIRRLGPEIRADYSASLLRLATHKKIIAGMPLAFGEGDTKGRVMNMAKWRKPKLWVSVIYLVLCAVVLVACAVNPDSTEPTVTTEIQAFAETRKITLENDPFPEGYYVDLDEEGNIIFQDGNNTVGGVICYVIPEGVYDPEDKYYDWLEEMGIPDYEDPDLFYVGGITSGENGWAAEFADDLDNKENRTVDRHHTFQVIGDAVYDIWFDLLKISFDESYEIRKAVNLPEPVETAEKYMPTVAGSDVVTNVEIVKYGKFNLALPAGITSREGEGCILLIQDGKEVGGLALRTQEQPNSPDSFSREWQEKIGVPEASDTSLGYLSSGSLYADYEITYFPDIPVNYDDNGNIIQDENGTYVLEHEITHYFFVVETNVYDLWFYNNRLPKISQENILKSCYIDGVTDIAAMQEKLTTEAEALEQCRAVLEQIQSSGAYKIQTDRHNGPNALNETTMLTEWGHGADRLHLAIIPESGGSSSHGGLLVDGKQYECDSMREWREITWWEWQDPWLASFRWDETVVSYQDTLEDESGISVMLRIDQPYSDGEDEQPHYFVNFNFDTNGNFRNVYVQANVFMNNRFTERESIVSLDPETVKAEIQKEYQNAIAFQAINEMGAGALFDPESSA